MDTVVVTGIPKPCQVAQNVDRIATRERLWGESE